MKGMVMAVLLVGFSALRGLAQDTGTISGEVYDTTEAIIGGVVMIEGNSKLGAYTDEEGKFVIKNVKPGSYTVTVTYFGYSSFTLKDIKVEAGKTTDLGKVIIQSEATETSTWVVKGIKTTNTEESAIKDKKESKQVIEVISAQQISKSQDRDAAQVMQRVPGVTIIDNRFVMIRGLSERYNVVMINDAIAPNTEVERRSFSFDLIPSQMIDRVSIYKSGAADIPGDFAAGVIKLYTKNVPDSNYFLVALTGGYRGGTTFKDYNTNYTGKTEFLGFADKTRFLPENFPSTAFLNSSTVTDAQKQQAALMLPNRFGYTTRTALPDLRLNIEMGRKFSLGKLDFGNITSVNYTNLYQAQTIKRFDYEAYDSTLGKSNPRTAFNDVRTANTVRLGIIHNWSVKLNDKNKIDFKNFFNQQAENETVLRDGIDYGSLGATDSLKSYSYRYTTRSIFSSQLGGRHKFNSNKTSFAWTIGYSHLSRNIPDWIRFRTHKKIGVPGPYVDIVPSSATLFENARFNSELTESVMMTSGALEHKFVEDADSSGISLKVGYYIESRSRDFRARWMSLKPMNNNPATDANLALPIDQIFSPAIVGSANGFKIEDGTNASDRYTAANQLYAGFAGLTIPLKSWNIQTGVRVEAYHQVLTSASSAAKINIDTFIVSPLPFLNTSYNFSEKMLARAAYSKTINRPEFRELAPFLFYDFDLNTNYAGNPGLKICNIHNADLRWEYYPSSSEMISLGVFYKRFNNPIEVVSIGTTPRQFSFQNAQYANNLGAEIEIRKSFDKLKVKFIKNLSFLFNGSLIYSKVHIDTSISKGQIPNRALQGQSPYVINTGFYYTKENKGVTVSLLYNIFGKRIFVVGDLNGNPTIYEMPRHSLDLTIQKKLTARWEGRIGIQDILNYKTRFFQDTNGDSKITSIDEPFLLTRRGTYFTLGVQYKF
jgi:TonB-dependent receptor